MARRSKTSSASSRSCPLCLWLSPTRQSGEGFLTSWSTSLRLTCCPKLWRYEPPCCSLLIALDSSSAVSAPLAFSSLDFTSPRNTRRKSSCRQAHGRIPFFSSNQIFSSSNCSSSTHLPLLLLLPLVLASYLFSSSSSHRRLRCKIESLVSAGDFHGPRLSGMRRE